MNIAKIVGLAKNEYPSLRGFMYISMSEDVELIDLSKRLRRNAQIEIKHQIALRDIVQSNSMVEATYRWLKSSFLYGKKILNAVQLEKYLQFYFHDHDEIKPHSAHRIYTPNEVYNGANPAISLTEVYQIASKNRRITNLASRCKIC